jgi:hypothetical protein
VRSAECIFPPEGWGLKWRREGRRRREVAELSRSPAGQRASKRMLVSSETLPNNNSRGFPTDARFGSPTTYLPSREGAKSISFLGCSSAFRSANSPLFSPTAAANHQSPQPLLSSAGTGAVGTQALEKDNLGDTAEVPSTPSTLTLALARACRKNPQNGNIYLSTSNTCSTILPHPHPSHFPPSPVPQYKSRPSRTKLNFLSPQTFVEPLSPGRSTARHRHTPTPRGDPS